MLSLANIFDEIAVIMAIATALGTIAVVFRQPLIMAFIVAGILIGPAGFALLTAREPIELLAELGIALLLFVVGLKLDPHEIRSVGKVAILTGMTQIFLTAVIGGGIALFLGFDSVTAFYLGLAFTFSSTIIIVKLLSDKREIEALHGRIAVGVLIIQDLVVVVMMIALSAFEESSQQGFLMSMLLIIIKGSGLLLGIIIIHHYFLSKILPKLACSTELLILFAIAWAVALAALADKLGFSKEVGAFVAGVVLAATPYRTTIDTRLVSVRDFLLLFFFINLGIHIEIEHLGEEIAPALLFSGLILLGKPLMFMILLGRMGYRQYTCVITSLSFGQISEFSLILASLGVSLGHISEETLGLITLIGLITMGVSTYMILYSHQIYEHCSSELSVLEKLIPKQHQRLGEISSLETDKIDIILFGLGRYGGNLMIHLCQRGLKVLGVDFDPHLVKFWREKGNLAYYGDAENPEFAATLPLETTQWVISTLPNKRVSLILLHSLKHSHFLGKIALTSHSPQEKELLYQKGADLVLFPFNDAAQEAASLMDKMVRSSGVRS